MLHVMRRKLIIKPLRTDGQTDRQTDDLPWQYRTLPSIAR